MIRRKVFIIKGYSNSAFEKQMDWKYVNSYSNFFQLAAGGAYFASEIILMPEPSVDELNKALYKEKLDFGIIVYIGHGANQEENQIFKLNKNEIIKPGQFTLPSKKQIIFLESCRGITNAIPKIDLSDKIPKFANGGIVRIALSKNQSREIYDSHIKRCEDGMMICYACKLGEEAYNYIFSGMLIQSAMDWHLDSSRHCTVLPIDELFRLTWIETVIASRDLGMNQTPHSKGDMNFPIAISKF